MILENQRSTCPLPVSVAAEALSVSRSGYYRWSKNKGKSNKEHRDQPVVDELLKIAETHTGYGYRRMTHALRRKGTVANHKRVLRIMRENNLLVKRKKFTPITTDSDHKNPIYPNLVLGTKAESPNQIWASDFTYIKFGDDYGYLVVEMDLFGRRILGWSFSRHLDTETAMDALQKALYLRRNDDLSGLVHHSDQGVQFTSFRYTECLRNHGIQISNSRRGNPYDNAFVESFFKTLKYEEVYMNEYNTFKDAHENIRRFIEDVYNEKRMHSALGYRTPVEFEMEEGLITMT
jgi:transposase InsO family protein